MINLASQLFFTEEKNQSISLFKQFLKSMIIAKKKKKQRILIKISSCLPKIKNDLIPVINAGYGINYLV